MKVRTKMDNIQELIVMYAPTIFMALTTLLNYLKTFKLLRTNASSILNEPRMVELRKELNNSKEELKEIKQRLLELTIRESELINELSKVQKYEITKNKAN